MVVVTAVVIVIVIVIIRIALIVVNNNVFKGWVFLGLACESEALESPTYRDAAGPLEISL